MSCLIPFGFGSKGGYNVPHTYDDKTKPGHVPRIRNKIKIPELPKINRDEYQPNTPAIYEEDMNVEPKFANPDNNFVPKATPRQNSNTESIPAQQNGKSDKNSDPKVTPQQNGNTDNISAPKATPRQNANTGTISAPKVPPQMNGNIGTISAPKVTSRKTGNTDTIYAPKVTPQQNGKFGTISASKITPEQNGNIDTISAPKITLQQNDNIDIISAPKVTPQQNGNIDTISAPKVTLQLNGNTEIIPVPKVTTTQQNDNTDTISTQQNGNTINNSDPKLVTPQQKGDVDSLVPEVPVRKQKKSVGFDNTPTIMPEILNQSDENPNTNPDESNPVLIITPNDTGREVTSNGKTDKNGEDNSKEAKKQEKREKKNLKAELKKAKENKKENARQSGSYREEEEPEDKPEDPGDGDGDDESASLKPEGSDETEGGDEERVSHKPEKRPAISKDYAAQELSEVKYTKYEKDAEATAVIKNALMANDFIKNLMDEERLTSVVEAMHSEEYEVGSFIIKEGAQGSHLYVSAEGNFEVFKDGNSVKLIGPGEVFGELAILYKSKRFASVKVTRKAKVWVLERSVFKKIMWITRKQEQENNLKFLSRVPILKNVHPTDLVKISDLLKRQFYLSGMKIVTQGEKGDDFFIIRGGTVSITKRPPGGGPEKHVGNLSRGDYFGEQALLHEDHRLATVTAKAPGAECLVLERKPFHKFLGNIKELTETHHRDIPTTTKSDNEKPFVFTSEYDHIKLEELEIIGTLGEGAFGRVEMVQYTGNKNKVFALKCLKKADIVHEHNQERAYNEKNIMIRCNSPFVCKLYNTYKDRKYVYFLMEPVLGGDVFSMMSRKKFLEEPAARFMAACVVEALEHLHGLDIIYRDLKPENLMLDSKGYVKVVDFGCSKFLSIGTKTDTVVGTPEYLAPELIKNMGHDRAVDYWALGIFIHELLLGRPPFRHQNPSRTLKLILRGIDSIDFDPKINRMAQILIKQLCRPIAVERLGYAKNGFKDIKDHDWFKDFKWEKLRSRKMKAPIVPSLKNMSKYPKVQIPPDETSNWDADF